MINNSDYDGTYKYKFIMPFIFFCALCMQTLGQHFIPKAYSYFIFIFIVYINYKLLGLIIKLWYLSYKTSKSIESSY